MHPESITERHRAEVDERRVWVDPQPDGMAYLSAYLSAEIALAAYARLTEIGTAQNAADDNRTLAHKRADALGDLLIDGDTCAAEGADAGGAAGVGERVAAGRRTTAGGVRGTGHGIRAKVLVTVPVLTLLGATEQPANLEGYGPIDPELARQLTADAPSFTRVLTDPVTSAILDFDRSTYVVPADLRLVLRVRDEACRAPACNRLAVHCQVDHNLDWALGGTTCAGNLAHLCLGHHNLKHHTRVSLRNLRDGRLEWTTPTGRTYVTYPAHYTGPAQAPGSGAPPGADDNARATRPPADTPPGPAPY